MRKVGFTIEFGKTEGEKERGENFVSGIEALARMTEKRLSDAVNDAGLEFDAYVDALDAVSYTHLDVYKRQVHGIGEYGGRFDRVAEAFREKNMAVLAFDLRGHGKSLGKRGHCAPRKDVLSDVSTLIEYAQAIYPEKKLILYGHSMGGNIVLDYRSRGRLNGEVAAYIVTAPWVRLVRPVPALLYKAVKFLSRVAPSVTIGSEINEADLGNLDCVKPFNDHPLVHNRISALCAVDGFETGQKLESGQLENNGRAKQIPLLLMHGEKDKICDVAGSRNIAARMKEMCIRDRIQAVF